MEGFFFFFTRINPVQEVISLGIICVIVCPVANLIDRQTCSIMQLHNELSSLPHCVPAGKPLSVNN